MKTSLKGYFVPRKEMLKTFAAKRFAGVKVIGEHKR